MDKDKRNAILNVPSYEEEDRKYMGQLLTKLRSAKDQREKVYEEFGNMTYLQRYQLNKRRANTLINAKRKNDIDTFDISAGTIEHKLEAVLSSVNSLNLDVEVQAFDKDDTKLALEASAVEEVMFVTNTLDEDDEKKVARQKELLMQGTVFVEEKWAKRYRKKKSLKGKFKGEFKGVEWTDKIEKFWEGCTREVKYGPNIYLGDITQFYMKNQPFIFEVVVKGWEETKSIFGKWENWQNVPKSRTNLGDTEDAEVDKRWIIDEIKEDQCEIIIYQDSWNDEYNVIINGVMMLPSEFPLSAISPYGNYTIEKQIFKIADAHFAYGRGFIQSSENLAGLLDEMLKLMVLKTRKSFMPSYINTSRKFISSRVLQAGQISMGIAADALQKVDDQSQGVTNSEFQMTRELQANIDKLTVSPQFTGTQGKTGATATEVITLQKQAQMSLSLTMYACALLERKLGYLRLWNILENWTKPVTKEVINGKEYNKYRKASRENNINGEGVGETEVIMMDEELPTAEEIRMVELEEEEMRGYPVKKIVINPDRLKNAVKKWYCVVVPKEKETSDLNKVLFREELADLMSVTQFGSIPDKDFIEERFATIYGLDRGKAFKKEATPMPQQEPQAQPGEMEVPERRGIDSNTTAMPNVKGVPTTTNNLAV